MILEFVRKNQSDYIEVLHIKSKIVEGEQSMKTSSK